MILLCFSLVNPASYEHVRDKWKPELDKFAPDVPILLVGLCREQRENFSQDAKHDDESRPISESEGKALAKSIGVRDYIECSAHENYNVKDAMDIAIFLGLEHARVHRKKKKEKKQKRCSVA